MPYQYKLIRNTDYICFDVWGEADTLEDARWFANEAMKEAEKYDCDRFLFDERKLVMNLTSHDVYLLAEEFSGKLLHSGFRVAALHTIDNAHVGSDFETMLRNRSFNYRSFAEREEAVAWLKAKVEA